MDPMIVVVAICAVGSVVYGVVHAYRSEDGRIRRTLRTARQVSIADAPEGEVVRLDGTVVPGETVAAPLTGRRCVYYVAIVEEDTGDDDWHECARETGGVSFAIDDGTGRAIVDLTDARVDVDLDRETDSGGLDHPTAAERDFLRRHRVEHTGRLFHKKLRYREGVFAVGERIAIMCQPVREPERAAARGEAGYRDAPPTRLRIGGSSRYPILLSDCRRVTQPGWRP